jgi:hypothetical protein
MKKWTKYEHLKSGEIYEASGELITNATNSQDGQYMRLYKNSEGRLFVREEMEFNEKFRWCND